jgi:hypothetical protein
MARDGDCGGRVFYISWMSVMDAMGCCILRGCASGFERLRWHARRLGYCTSCMASPIDRVNGLRHRTGRLTVSFSEVKLNMDICLPADLPLPKTGTQRDDSTMKTFSRFRGTRGEDRAESATLRSQDTVEATRIEVNSQFLLWHNARAYAEYS